MIYFVWSLGAATGYFLTRLVWKKKGYKWTVGDALFCLTLNVCYLWISIVPTMCIIYLVEFPPKFLDKEAKI